MENVKDINNLLISKFIENSLFTSRQIQIIYKIKKKEKKIEGISSGAYYREVKQSKTKLAKLIYSILLLNLLGIINTDQIITLESILSKLNALDYNHDVYHDKDLLRVMNVIEDLIERMINI